MNVFDRSCPTMLKSVGMRLDLDKMSEYFVTPYLKNNNTTTIFTINTNIFITI